MMRDTTRSWIVLLTVGLLTGAYYVARRYFELDLLEVAWEALPTARNFENIESACVWCGAPAPEYDEDHEEVYYNAMRNWTMLSYGDVRKISKVACEPLHMELWLMTNHA
jgi:hypothetical protein